MKLRHNFLVAIEAWKRNRVLAKCKRRYADFKEETEYDNGEYKFICGVTTLGDLSSITPCLYSMNDIDIIYSREKKQYILSIETAHWFDTQEGIVRYLQSLLEHFAKWMDEQGYDKSAPYKFWMAQPSALFEAESIPELYTNFKIFVEGHKRIARPDYYRKDSNL